MKVVVSSVAVAAVCVLTGAFTAAAGEVDLSQVQVVRAEKESECQKKAADELVKHLELVAGSKVGDSGFKFVFARPEGVGGAEPYTARARRIGDAVYFWGYDTKAKSHNSFFGSAFAVYGFLEKFLGVKWVEPGDDGIVFKPKSKIDLPDDWEYEYKYWPLNALIRKADADYGLRMRYAEKRPFVYGHAFTKYQKMYLKDHPEWFGLDVDGKRGTKDEWAAFAKLCDTNPEVVDHIVEEWKERKTPHYFNVCVNDGSPGYCYCENCRAYDYYAPGEPFLFDNTDRHLAFYNRIAAKATKIRPDVMLVAYLYGYYQLPPRREVVEYPDNMLFGIVPSGTFEKAKKAFAGFKKAGVKHFFFRPNYLCGKGLLPIGTYRFLYDTFHFYYNNGAVGYDYDGAPNDTQLISYYVVFRQCAFPELTIEQILDEYMSQYGAAADVVMEYYERIRRRHDAVRLADGAPSDRPQWLRWQIKDDIEMMRSHTRFNSIKDLTEDIQLLETADLSRLSPVERRRFDKLHTRAKGYIDAYQAVYAKALEKAGVNRAWLEEKSLMGARPSVKDGETASITQEGHREFLALPAAERLRRLGDADSRRTMRGVGTRPHPVTFSWDGRAVADFKIVRERDGKAVFAVKAGCPIAVYNLEVGERYSWSAQKDGKVLGKGLFGTAADGPRWIGVPDAPVMKNMRDLGGWMKGFDGRSVRQGLVYRSAAFDEGASAGRSLVAAPNAREFLVGRLGIKTDVDLRADDEVGGRTESPLGAVSWVRAPISAEADPASPGFRAAFAKVFGLLADEKNLPLDIHGASGFARTGAVAMLLEGLLGVSEESARIDWELSAFSGPEFDAAPFDRILAALGGAPGDTLAQKAEAYALSCGISKADILRFRAIMLAE